MTNQTIYQNRIRSRSKVRFIFGLFPRLISYVKNYYITNLAKRRGAYPFVNLDLETMCVVSGKPANKKKYRKIIHSNLIFGTLAVKNYVKNFMNQPS